MNTSYATLLCSIALVSVAAQAQPLYKSTGSDGAVSYGDQPAAGAADVRRVEVDPGPTHQQAQDARMRGERTRASADAMEAKRQAQEQVAGVKREARGIQRDAEQQIDEFQQLLQQQLKQQQNYRRHGPFGP